MQRKEVPMTTVAVQIEHQGWRDHLKLLEGGRKGKVIWKVEIVRLVDCSQESIRVNKRAMIGQIATKDIQINLIKDKGERKVIWQKKNVSKLFSLFYKQ